MAAKFKIEAIPFLLRCCGSLSDKLRELLTEGGALTAAGLAFPPAVPLVALAPAIVEQAVKYYENREHKDALIELFRESLLTAVSQCRDLAAPHTECTGDDRALLDLWTEGLAVSTKSDPLWALMLEEDVPAAALTATGNLNAPAIWPALRALLANWTDWFRYRRNSGPAALGLTITHVPLAISRWLDQYLAANLPPLFLEEFRPKITSGKEEEAFRQVLLAALSKLNHDVSPLDPLDPVTALGRREPTEHIHLLDANNRAIPYIGRESDLAQLWTWLSDPNPISFQVICGRGGAGKTRIAYRLLELIEEREPFTWHAGILPQERSGSLAWDQFARWRGERPTLIVLDYASSFSPQLKPFIRLLERESARAGADAQKIRVLLLERQADPQQGWYHNLLESTRDAPSALFPNPPLVLSTLDPQQRRDLLNYMFQALHALDVRKKLPNPLRLSAPPAEDPLFATDRFSDPLVLCMAAAVAHQQRDLRALTLNRLDLARELARSESRRLKLFADTPEKQFLLVHLAAYITMTGSLTASELQLACETERSRVAGDSAWKVFDLVETLRTRLPASNAAFAVDPITPDIIGEAFLLKALQEQPHSAEATVLRASESKPGKVTNALVQIIQDYSPHQPDHSAVDESDSKWTLEIFTSLLRHRAGTLSDDAFWQIHTAIPLQSIAMNAAALDFYNAIARGGSRGKEDFVRLVSLESYSLYASQAGMRREALASIAEAVQHYRELLGTADAFLPALANALNNQASLQSEMGQRRQALASMTEAVQHYRELVKGNTDAFLPDLAGALNNQANRRSEMGQREVALESIIEAVQHYRELVTGNADAFLPNLAMALNNQSTLQSETGQRGEALASIIESVQIRRELVKGNADAFLPNLANAINNQANRQSEMGQRGEALASIIEAVLHYRELVRRNAEAFLPNLAIALNNQATLQSEMGQREQALASITEAVQIRWELVKGNADAFLPDLAMSKGVWGDVLLAQENAAEALDRFSEGITLISPLARALPEAHFPLALQLSQRYLAACELIGRQPDPQFTWPIELLKEIQSESAPKSE